MKQLEFHEYRIDQILTLGRDTLDYIFVRKVSMLSTTLAFLVFVKDKSFTPKVVDIIRECISELKQGIKVDLKDRLNFMAHVTIRDEDLK